MDFLGGSVVKRIYLPVQELQETQVRPLVGKTLWRRKWQSTAVILPGKSHGRKSLTDYCAWVYKESDMTERACMHACTQLSNHFRTGISPNYKLTAQTRLSCRTPPVLKVSYSKITSAQTHSEVCIHRGALAWLVPVPLYVPLPGRITAWPPQRELEPQPRRIFLLPLISPKAQGASASGFHSTPLINISTSFYKGCFTSSVISSPVFP